MSKKPGAVWWRENRVARRAFRLVNYRVAPFVRVPGRPALGPFLAGFLPPTKGWRSPAIIRASFPAEVWPYLLCFQNLRRSHAGFIRAHQWKSRNGKNSPEFRSAKSVRESARVQAGGPFPHAGETAQRGTRERNEPK